MHLFLKSIALGLATLASQAAAENHYDEGLGLEGSLTAAIWYSQAEQLSGSIGIEQDRVFGTDESMRLSVGGSEFSQSISLTSTDPDFFESPYYRQLSFAVFNQKADASQNGDYSFSGAEARIGFGRQITNDYAVHFGAGVREFKLENSVALPVYINDYLTENGEENTTVFSYVDVVLDRTSGGLHPSHGYRVSFENELGWTEGTEYLKSQLSGQYYKPLTESLNFQARGSIAKGFVASGNAYPIFENFFAGGPNSVRGFAQNAMGPTSQITDSTDVAYTGGTFSVTGGVEVSSQLAQRPDWRAIAFVDFGNVFADDQSVTLSAIRKSVGVGVQWDSAAGPVRISYAHPLNAQPTDTKEELQITFGATF